MIRHNRIPLLLSALLCLTIGTARAEHDYYVSPQGNDHGDGSQARPYQSIAMAAVRVRPGDVVHVLPGVYPLSTTLLTTAHGNAGHRIRYVSDERWGAKIVSSAGMPSAAWENAGNYVEIVGFDITGDGNEGILNRASHVRIVGNHVHDLPASFCKLRSPTGAGINSGANYAAEDNDVIGNVVHDIGVPRACTVGQGIYVANKGGHIENNIAFHNGAYGIHLWHAATANIVTNNLVFENGLGGIWVGADEHNAAINQDTVVANNIIYRNGDWSIREDGVVGPNHYEHNLIFGNGHGDKPLLLRGNTDVATIHADPRFVHYAPDGSGDYHLQPGSPALGSADPARMPQQDFYGAPRSHPDLGPFSRPEDAGGKNVASK